ncbi:MFS transporter [Peribacillus simplex]|uniref:MFS transporter n=1 Tax=Peribacillus simplex TaxID=1478 RepID=UPI003CEA238A
MYRNFKSFFINRNFTYIWLGAIFVTFGFQVYSFALPIIIYDYTESSFAMSLMKLANFLPIFIFGIISGQLVDRHNKKKIMLSVLAIEIFLLFITLTWTYFYDIKIWLIYFLGFSLSTCSYIFSIAKTSILPIVVKKEDLLRANSKSSFTTVLLGIIGPSLAGTFLHLHTYKLNFFIFMISLLILFFFIKAVKINNNIPIFENGSKKEKKRIKFKSVFDVLANKNEARDLTIIVTILAFANSLVNGILIFFAYEYINISSYHLGWIYSFSSIGGLLSSLFIKKIRAAYGSSNLILFSILLNLFGTVSLLFTSSWWFLGFSIFFRTFGVSLISIFFITYRQENTPINLMGRVSNTFNMVVQGIPVLGTLLAGIWGEFLDVRLLFGLTTLIVFFSLIKHLKMDKMTTE